VHVLWKYKDADSSEKWIARPGYTTRNHLFLSPCREFGRTLNESIVTVETRLHSPKKSYQVHLVQEYGTSTTYYQTSAVIRASHCIPQLSVTIRYGRSKYVSCSLPTSRYPTYHNVTPRPLTHPPIHGIDPVLNHCQLCSGIICTGRQVSRM